MEGSKFAEIRSDHQDENGATYLDGYKTADDNETGVVIAVVIKGEPYWRDPEFQFDPYVKEVLAEVKEAHKKDREELEEKISKAVTSVVYTADAKPRREFTNGSPLEVKLSLMRAGVEKIMKLI